MKKIAVTGGSGRAGTYVVKELLARGYDLINIDVNPPTQDRQAWLCPFRQCDTTQYGQVFAALYGFDAVVHLAADPRPDRDHYAGAQRFHNNTLSAFNVFNAAAALGLERVVWASSETVYGFPFDVVIPDYAPIDEQHRYSPRSSYALSKMLAEQMTAQFNQWSGIPFIGLQFSNIIMPEDYAVFPSFWNDPKQRIFDLWSYVDCRDAAQAVALSLTAELSGAENFIIAADETVMTRPSADLMAEYFPTTHLRAGLGTYQSLMSSEKAKALLGYLPQYHWRDQVGATV
ncbi:MAG: NAD(P)-dependent oxidoreductase [Anaerolineae bacterium]|nr:NAD(P)-dependent oxidoreductase [Anaerolineae bacterium]